MGATQSKVRTHTRRNPDGSTSKVSQHSRTGKRAARKKSLGGRGVRNFKKAAKYFRRNKAAAAALGGLATIQVASFLTLRGLSLMGATVAVVATTVAAITYAISAGGRLP